MFEEVTRKSIRFPTVRGEVTVEDLWAMPLTSKSNFDLDNVAKTVNSKIRESEVDSFVKASKADPDDVLRLEVVKHIIGVKMDEAKTRADTAKTKRRREELMAALDAKNTQALAAMSAEDIQKELAKLGS